MTPGLVDPDDGRDDTDDTDDENDENDGASRAQEDRQIEQCENCGRVFVNWHRCRGELAENGSVTSDERDRLSRLDDGDADDTVLYVPGRGDSAYHEAVVDRDEQGRFTLKPACEAQIVKETGSNGEARTWKDATRAEARDYSPRFPCRECHDLDDGGDA